MLDSTLSEYFLISMDFILALGGYVAILFLLQFNHMAEMNNGINPLNNIRNQAAINSSGNSMQKNKKASKNVFTGAYPFRSNFPRSAAGLRIAANSFIQFKLEIFRKPRSLSFISALRYRRDSFDSISGASYPHSSLFRRHNMVYDNHASGHSFVCS